MINSNKVGILIVAAGMGKRFGNDDLPKQYQPLLDKPLIAWSLDAFQKIDAVDEIAVAINPDHRPVFERLIDQTKWSKLKCVVDGGVERQDSVLNGLKSLVKQGCSIAAIHDAARPFPPADAVVKAIEKASSGGAAILAAPITDTIKQCAIDGRVECTLDRTRLWSAQTPQAAPIDLLIDTIDKAKSNGHNFTDEASALEWAGIDVNIIVSSSTNIKITHSVDLEIASFLLSREKV